MTMFQEIELDFWLCIVRWNEDVPNMENHIKLIMASAISLFLFCWSETMIECLFTIQHINNLFTFDDELPMMDYKSFHFHSIAKHSSKGHSTDGHPDEKCAFSSHSLWSLWIVNICIINKLSSNRIFQRPSGSWILAPHNNNLSTKMIPM